MHPCCKESEWYLKLHLEECCQPVEEYDPYPLLHIDKATPRVLCAVWDSSVQEKT